MSPLSWYLSPRRRGFAAGLLAAALFGAATPFAKLLLPGAGPLLLAGLFYLGAAAALSIALPVRRALAAAAASSSGSGAGVAAPGEARLTRRDLPLLALVLLLGGVAGPLFLLWGLARTSGFAGALLLNLEAPLTLLLAVLAFGEHVERSEAIAAGIIVLGASLLGIEPGPLRADPLGALSIAAACLCWALDNNLTQRLSLRDPLAIARAKTLGAGACTFAAALVMGARLPPPPQIALALLVGALGYGASIALDVIALRELGAARESAVFATAPFAGALLSVLLLGDRPGPLGLAAAGALIVGVAGLLWARHGHLHQHASTAHDHRHVHDAHHRHAHDALEVPRGADGLVLEPHAHWHTHVALVHDHPHLSDAHHRHQHR